MQAMDLSTGITVVTVAYNSMAVLPKMMASLPDGTPVVVVDNSPSHDSAMKVLCEQIGATLIRNDKNRGFGAACNQGAKQASTKFLLFLNPDTELDPRCFPALLTAAKAYPSASAFNPRLVDGNGKIAFRRRTDLEPKAGKYRGPVPIDDMEIPVLSGAALFIEKDKFDRVQGFDENIFLYHEDDDLALRLKKSGPLMHVHGAVVCHSEGDSTEQSPKVDYFKAYHLARSRVYAKAKHSRPMPRLGVIWRGVRKFFNPRSFNRRNRTKHIGFLAGALSTIRDGGKHVE